MYFGSHWYVFNYVGSWDNSAGVKASPEELFMVTNLQISGSYLTVVLTGAWQ